jgi:hypothetical protein
MKWTKKLSFRSQPPARGGNTRGGLTAVKSPRGRLGYPVDIGGSSIVSRTTPPERQAAHADREAFNALAPNYPELLQAVQREVRHRLTLGQFAPDEPTPEQLLDMALERAWRECRRLPPALGIRAWAPASIFRTAEALGAREDKRRRGTTDLLP